MTDHEDEVEKEVERLSAVLVPYLCERTGLSRIQVTTLLNAQEAFWESQPHVIGRMFILGIPVDGGTDGATDVG